MEKNSSMAPLFSDEEEYDFLEMSSSSSEEDENDHLSFSQWEFISASDAESEEPKQERRHQDHEEEDNGSGSFSTDDQIESQVLPFLDDVHDDDNEDDEDHGHDEDDEDHGHDEDDDDDHDVDDVVYDLNDELVPWSVSGKFGRQRMRKLGKRGFTKMYNSKRSPFLFVRPGAVHGKRGLGMKHSF